MVVSQTLLSLEEASMTTLACTVVSGPGSASSVPGEDPLEALVLGGKLGAGREGFGVEDRG
jgi:hypothetical protein